MANTPAGNAERQALMQSLLSGALNVLADARQAAVAGLAAIDDEADSEPEPVPTPAQLSQEYINILRTRLDVHEFIASASRGCKRTFQEFLSDRSYSSPFLRDYGRQNFADSFLNTCLVKTTNWQRALCARLISPIARASLRTSLRTAERMDYVEATFGHPGIVNIDLYDEVAECSSHRSPFRIRRGLEGNMRTWTKSACNLPAYFSDNLRDTGVLGYRDWLVKAFERDWALAEAKLFEAEERFLEALIEDGSSQLFQPRMRSWTEFVVPRRLPRPMY